MAGTPHITTKMENRSYSRYTLPRRSIPGSLIMKYLKKKNPTLTTGSTAIYTLARVMTKIRRIISTEHHYDSRNRELLIIRDYQLERALRHKYLHVSELKYVILYQMENVTPEHMQLIMHYTKRRSDKPK